MQASDPNPNFVINTISSDFLPGALNIDPGTEGRLIHLKRKYDLGSITESDYYRRQGEIFKNLKGEVPRKECDDVLASATRTASVIRNRITTFLRKKKPRRVLPAAHHEKVNLIGHSAVYKITDDKTGKAFLYRWRNGSKPTREEEEQVLRCWHEFQIRDNRFGREFRVKWNEHNPPTISEIIQLWCDMNQAVADI